MIETWVCWKRENKSKGKQIDEKPEFLFGISLYFSIAKSQGWARMCLQVGDGAQLKILGGWLTRKFNLISKMGVGEGNGYTKEGGGGHEDISPQYFWMILKKSQVHISFLKQKMVALIEKKMISKTAISRLKMCFTCRCNVLHRDTISRERDFRSFERL